MTTGHSGYGTYFADGQVAFGDLGGSNPENVGLTIGKYCSIATGVKFFIGGNHRMDWVTTYPPLMMGVDETGHPAQKKGIYVGNDVWIGQNSTIVDGARIEDGVVIGAYSVVRGRIPAYTIAYGNPCKIQKRRFDLRTSIELCQIAWWDWEPDKVARAYGDMRTLSIRAFIDKYGEQDVS